MNKLEFLVVHCSATTVAHNTQPEHIRAWHRERFKSGNRIGYRLLITLDGVIHRFIDVNDNAFVEKEEQTFGAIGFNHNSHHICYAGGLSKEIFHTKNGTKLNKIQDTRTEKQKQSLRDICFYYVKMNPEIKIIGHNQIQQKGCPSFFVPTWLESIDIPTKNIDYRDPFGMKSYLSKPSNHVDL